MNALIDTESKSYREGYTKGDLCTYFIDSQAKFDAWVANTTGNNYTHVIIKGGCGSTLIACEQLKRTCYMMELDTRYCDVIIKRWENYTGEKAVKIWQKYQIFF